MGGKYCPKCKTVLFEDASECDLCDYSLEEADKKRRKEMKSELHKAGQTIYEKCQAPFKYIIGNILENNERYLDEDYDDTATQQQILKHGFSANQKEWILETLEQLKAGKTGDNNAK